MRLVIARIGISGLRAQVGILIRTDAAIIESYPVRFHIKRQSLWPTGFITFIFCPPFIIDCQVLRIKIIRFDN